MSLWYCETHGLVGPTACCDQASRATIEPFDVQPAYTNNPRDWQVDFAHENGRYLNKCRECGEPFVGHKRRFICRVCANG